METRRAGPLRQMADLLRALARRQDGNVAIIFAVSILAIMCVILISLDLANLQRSRSKVQDGLDAATLALATSQITDDKAADQSGSGFLAANLAMAPDIKI